MGRAQMATLRVLCVDDDATLLEAIRRFLLGLPKMQSNDERTALASPLRPPEPSFAVQDIVVHTEKNGTSALAWAKQQVEEHLPLPHVALVDFSLNDVYDGVATIQNLWQIAPDLQVILCTASVDHTWAELSSALGHRASLLLLRKPFETSELRQMILALGEKAHLHASMRQDCD
jgi:CheY-like chemotaxis protein